MTSTAASGTLYRTPFHQYHVQQGAKMVEFVGWEMPMLYRSIIEEHRQVRTSGGMFDVSHMGRLTFEGRDARRFLDRVCTRQIFGMDDGQCRYSIVCNDRGGCRDDTLVYRLDEHRYLMVCNAANRTKLLEHFKAHRRDLELDLRDETFETAMLAVQGPRVMELIGRFAPDVAQLKRYRFTVKNVLGADVIISRTGYTGEDGVEVILPALLAVPAVEMVVGEAGADQTAVQPAGLGARDSLRLEAAMALYGHEISEEIDPLAAGLDFAVKLDKGDADEQVGHFIGQEALKEIARQRPQQRLSGLVLQGRRTARQGMKVRAGEAEIGFVTSACLSPTLDKPIAMAYLDTGHAEPGGSVTVDVKGGGLNAEIVKLPFYKRS
ncbi:MAG: glycine cleavage system aminomethyltransferase GcvT [Planctomycetota bacterium]|jgi:aminomethyltransferase